MLSGWFRFTETGVLLRRRTPDRRRAEGKGVEFTAPVVDRGYGLVTAFRMPGGVEGELYQPLYKK